MPHKNTIENIIDRANKVHNNKFSYEEAKYVDYHTKLAITCKLHGIFWQSPANHIKGKGCPKCVGRNKTTQDFIKESYLIHNDTYDYSKVNYEKSHKKVKIICKIHGEFEQSPDKHLSGQGCRKCARIKIGAHKAKPTKENNLLNYPELCKEWSKDNIKNPIDFKSCSNKKVEWYCYKCKNYYTMRIVDRTSRLRGCPKCKFSKGELKIEKHLIKNNIIYKSQFRIKECIDKKELPFDFAIFDKNKNLLGLIEFNGEQHYNKYGWYAKNIETTQLHDKIKQEYCKQNDISLLIIPYTEYKNIEKIIEEWINKN